MDTSFCHPANVTQSWAIFSTFVAIFVADFASNCSCWFPCWTTTNGENSGSKNKYSLNVHDSENLDAQTSWFPWRLNSPVKVHPQITTSKSNLFGKAQETTQMTYLTFFNTTHTHEKQVVVVLRLFCFCSPITMTMFLKNNMFFWNMSRRGLDFAATHTW